MDPPAVEATFRQKERHMALPITKPQRSGAFIFVDKFCAFAAMNYSGYIAAAYRLL